MKEAIVLPDPGTGERDRLLAEVMSDLPQPMFTEAEIDEMARLDAMRPRFIGTAHEI